MMTRFTFTKLEDIDAVKGNDSRYGWPCKNFGQDFADLVMRDAEVASWNIKVRKMVRHD